MESGRTKTELKDQIRIVLVIFLALTGLVAPVSALDLQSSDEGLEELSVYTANYEELYVNVPSAEYVPGEIIVKFKPGATGKKVAEINAREGTLEIYESPYAGFKLLKVPKSKTVEEMIEIYSKNPNVEYAVPNAVSHAFMVPNDPYYTPYQWNFKSGTGGINAEPAWDVSSGEGVIVAVLDSGVAYENYGPYIRAPDLANTNFIPGYDFVNNDDHANDDHSHGTHVAGTLAQSTNNAAGVAGVAYNCIIMPVKVLDVNGNGTLQQLIDGIYFATDNGAKVISMSLGFPPGYYPGPALDAALDYAYNNGVTTVAASGNDETGTVNYPAAYEKCIAVGATRYDGSRAHYSNYGSALDVMAPGGDVDIDQNGDGYGDGILQNTFNPTTKDPTVIGYWFFEGTSMATPHVSAIAAMLIASGKEGPDSVRTAIEATARDMGTAGWDPEYGYGIVDAKAALDYVPIPNTPPVAEAGGPYTGSEGTAVSFDGSASYDTDGSIVTYEWDFGDGSTGSGVTPEHIYSIAGTYNVTLTVTDNQNAVDTDAATVEVTEAATGNVLHIADVSVTTSSRISGKNTFVSATAVVTILDINNSPVEGATVSGYWSGASGDLDSAVTDATGKVTVRSDEVKYKNGTLTFTFTVNGMSHTIPWDGNTMSGTGTYP
ncbi:S8 family serine peptidase [Methanosarcina sp. KYL-1]|uniref:S8 family serine peptidase n=1 Tax=Methanosarcina sp. KYL-1 TaxID=2602068 RepID=UPI0021007945|nr:S8 family serine peptidase [Methanosarcina sp. KYL-1]MCQ1535410.1 S8 family serine peptidase [Methanosarcina sp. KYL-1]